MNPGEGLAAARQGQQTTDLVVVDVGPCPGSYLSGRPRCDRVAFPKDELIIDQLALFPWEEQPGDM